MNRIDLIQLKKNLIESISGSLVNNLVSNHFIYSNNNFSKLKTIENRV